MIKRLLSIAAALCIAMTAVLPSAVVYAAQTETVTLQAPHSKEEINSRWAALKPTYTGDPYEQKPVVDFAPFSVGKVKSEVLNDALNMTNFARYVAGLGSDVTIVKDFQESAQYGAFLLAHINGGLTHTPANPGTIDKETYDKGYEGTSSSNLASYYKPGWDGHDALPLSIEQYLSDRNTETVGHRQWVLDPLMKGTGFGMATSSTDKYYSTMWTVHGTHLNGNGTATKNYDAIAWPAAGYHPLSLYNEDIAWSLQINSDRFKVDGDLKAAVTGPFGTDTVSAKNVKSMSSSWITVVFNPVTSYAKNGTKYDVELSGISRTDGTPVTIKYSVEFFKLSESATAAPAQPTNAPAQPANDEINVEPDSSTIKPVSTVGGFKDVKSDAYYADAVKWAVENNITSGVTDTEFAPDDTCSRAQILTFLYRAVGSPESWGESPFEDISDDGDYYYYDAALWAYDMGMVTDSEFAADTPCTRAATVMYLWQNAGLPIVYAYKGFDDIPYDADYVPAVAWAEQNGITSGTSDTEFSPDAVCSRGQIVTFLYRALK